MPISVTAGRLLRRRLTAAKAYEKIEHYVLDAHYLILGALEGAFATREKKLQRWYLLLCPEGRLYS